jgi:hypothetical protein
MQSFTSISGVGAIFRSLAATSARPRYSFLVLQLVAEAANSQGRAGPLVPAGVPASGHQMLLRDWLCTQIMPMSERDGRRAALRARITEGLADRLTGDCDHDQMLINGAVDEQALAVGRANVSRAISDLVRAGLVRRHYAGYATNHANRGGGRHAVYVVEPDILAALGKSTGFAPCFPQGRVRQGQLFAA